MTQKETNLRSILFLVIGILLLLSLIICIYIVSSERDLVKINGEVTEISDDVNAAGDPEITVNYDVDGQPYNYYYYHKGDIQVGDNVTIYYHESNPTLVQRFKTNKLIFIWPVIGLALCILGLFELFKKSDDDDDEEFETAVIGVVGNTQQLKIVTDATEAQVYEPTPEEVVEAPVKTVAKEEVVETSTVETSIQEEVIPIVETSNVDTVVEAVPEVVVESSVETSVVNSVPESVPVAAVATSVETNENVKIEEPTNEVASSPVTQMEEAIVKKVKTDVSGSTLNEEEIKKVIKDVLKEVIQEVKEEKAPVKPVVQKKVLPNNYYISGTSLIYEEAGKEPQEVELKSIKSVVRTVNSAGNVVKLVVSNEAVKCILTNMKNIDLEQLASLLNNKMRTIDESFKEEIEYKEY